MATGDHICVNRGPYWHHGIYLGNGRVIHYTGYLKDKGKNAAVKIESIQKFAKGREIYYGDSKVQYSRNEIVKRAKSRIGEKDYDIVGNNCEQFVNWCRNGQHKSQQVNAVAAGVALWAPYIAAYAYLKQKFSAPKPLTPQKADENKYNSAPKPPTPQKADGSKYNAEYYRKKRMIQRRIKSARCF